MSELDQSLSHSKWDCKYHVVIRAQTTAENHLRPDPSPIGADLPLAGAAERMPDARRASAARPRTHVHCDSPKHPVASVIGFLKGKSAIAIARLCGKERNFSGEHFRAPGLRRLYSGVRTGAGPPIHPRAGRGGWNSRTILKQPVGARRATPGPTTRPPLRRPNSSSPPLRRGCLPELPNRALLLREAGSPD